MIKFLKFIPFQLTIFLVLGILIGKHLAIQPKPLITVSSFTFLLFLIIYYVENKGFNASLKFTALFFILSFFVGIGTVTFNNETKKKLHYLNSFEFSTDNDYEVLISIKKRLKPSNYYHRFEAQVEQLNGQKAIGKIVLNIKQDSSNILLNSGQFYLLKTQFSPISKPLNPYGFNYKSYLQNKQIYHQIVVLTDELFKLEYSTISVKGIASKIRNSIIFSLEKNGFKNDELAVINALLLGQRQDISEELLESYTGAGAIHILAVSGLHVGVILILLTFIFKPLHYFKNGKNAAIIIVIILLWVYAVIAGLTPSVVRAVTMFTALAIGMHLNRPTNVYNSLVISMFFLLLFHPFYLFEIGFQLSYLAVFFIVWIQPKLDNLWVSKFWFFRKFWQLFTVSIAAQIGVLPLSLYYFHQFPSLFFVSNLVIIPFLGFILIVGITVIILAVLNILPALLGNFYMHIIEKMNAFVSWIASKEDFLFTDIAFSFSLLIASYICIITFVKWFEKKTAKRLLLLLSSLVVIQFVVLFEKYERETAHEFIVFNKSNASIFLDRNGNKTKVFSSLDSININDYVLKPYFTETGTEYLSEVESIQNIYKFLSETILVVNSLGIYNFETVKPSIVIFRNSPKINLERLLKKLNPELIIADGSNYKSYVENWKQTCLKNKTPFYNTMQKGAFMLQD